VPRPLKGVIRMLLAGNISVHRRSEDIVVSQKIDSVTLCVFVVSSTIINIYLSRKGNLFRTWEIVNPEGSIVMGEIIINQRIYYDTRFRPTIIIPFSVPDEFIATIDGMWKYYQSFDDVFQ